MTERLLLVTADDVLARVAAEPLAAAGLELWRERAAVAGVEACEQARPAAVVWDEELPEAADGALVARLRGTGAAVVVVVARGDMAAGARALRGGAEQFVAKPVDPALLAAVVARAADAARWRRRCVELENGPPPAAEAPHRPRTLADVEREQIERALRHHGGNRTRAARELGISRATLINKIRGYALDL